MQRVSDLLAWVRVPFNLLSFFSARGAKALPVHPIAHQSPSDSIRALQDHGDCELGGVEARDLEMNVRSAQIDGSDDDDSMSPMITSCEGVYAMDATAISNNAVSLTGAAPIPLIERYSSAGLMSGNGGVRNATVAAASGTFDPDTDLFSRELFEAFNRKGLTSRMDEYCVCSVGTGTAKVTDDSDFEKWYMMGQGRGCDVSALKMM